MTEPLIDRLGGLTVLRELTTEFYARVYADAMIGFMFHPIDRAMLIDHEVAFVARMLGSRSVEYKGRSMKRAHSGHRIMGGQFARRQQLLQDVLCDHDVPEDVQRAWLDHNESLRSQVTTDAGSDCTPQLAPAHPPTDTQGDAARRPRMLDPFKGL